MDQTKEADELLLKCKFAVDLISIQLNLKRPIQCTIKYRYKLFYGKSICTEKFTAFPDMDEGQKIPDSGYYDDLIRSSVKESELKDYLKNNELMIRVYDDEMIVGTARVDLMKFFDEESPKGCQRSFFEKVSISKEDESEVSENEEEIGTIECYFVLVTEEYTKCKSCNLNFLKTSIINHVKRTKTCMTNHTNDDMIDLQALSKEVQKKKRNDRDRAKYNSETRALKHTKSYNPEKRALKHKKTYIPTKHENGL